MNKTANTVLTKKEYCTPKMRVIKLRNRGSLLYSSTDPDKVGIVIDPP